MTDCSIYFNFKYLIATISLIFCGKKICEIYSIKMMSSKTIKIKKFIAYLYLVYAIDVAHNDTVLGPAQLFNAIVIIILELITAQISYSELCIEAIKRKLSGMQHKKYEQVEES